MKKIIRGKRSSPRVTAEPFFDVLNKYFKELLFDGNHPEFTQEVQEGIDVWKSIDCNDTSCDECMFFKWQGWINNLDTNAWDLCDIIEKSLDKSIKKRVKQDVMDVPGALFPGNACSRQ